MDTVKTDRITLKKFGMTMAVVLLAIALFSYFRHKAIPWQIAVLAVIFCMAGVIYPRALALTYELWMHCAKALAWVNTRLILLVMFYGVFTPLGLAMRLARVDLLDRRLQKGKASYWQKKEDKTSHTSDYRRQF
jgi:hypothetical protein